jgi:hypothetical protein
MVERQPGRAAEEQGRKHRTATEAGPELGLTGEQDVGHGVPVSCWNMIYQSGHQFRRGQLGAPW